MMRGHAWVRGGHEAATARSNHNRCEGRIDGHIRTRANRVPALTSGTPR